MIRKPPKLLLRMKNAEESLTTQLLLMGLGLQVSQEQERLPCCVHHYVVLQEVDAHILLDWIAKGRAVNPLPFRYILDTVTKIKVSKEQLLDVVVPDGGQYIANGFMNKTH